MSVNPVLKPLECNPDVFNKFLTKLGINDYEFTDVFGLDPDLLAFVPRPVRALLLVFPISETYETFKTAQDAHYKHESNACWSQQTVGNTCGTMAVLHALANGVPNLGNGLGSDLIHQFQSLKEEDRHEFMETNPEIIALHKELADSGESSVSDDLSCENHYVCLTKSGKDIVELDGRRKGPLLRKFGLKGDDILNDSVSIVKEYLDREKESGNNDFAILALVDKS